MNDSQFFNAAKTVGLKGPLGDGSFVGRQREVQALRSAMLGSQITPIWIFGPRRIGKSSLSNRISSSGEINVIRVSCDQIEWTNLEDFSSFLANEASVQVALKFNLSSKAILRELAKGSSPGQRIIFVLDELDRIAVNLQQEEQAFFRATLHAHPYFGVIFISRLRPQQLLQDYTEESSRLLGICNFIKVPMLVLGDIVELKQRIAEICGDALSDWLPQWIYERVGGYPVAVQGLFHEYLLLADRLGVIPSLDQMADEEHSFFERVRFDLKGLWNDLSYDIRQALKAGKECDDKVVGELKSLNMFQGSTPLKPIWLLDLADEAEEGHPSEGQGYIALAEKLFEHVRRCNQIALRKGLSQVFQVTQAALEIFSIARKVGTEDELNERVNLLHRICIENTNSKKLEKATGDQCLIPKQVRPVYKKSDGYNILVAYRNFSSHDPSQDLGVTESSERYKNVGTICCKYLGGEKFKPFSEADYDKIYKGILKDIVESLVALEKALTETALATG